VIGNKDLLPFAYRTLTSLLTNKGHQMTIVSIEVSRRLKEQKELKQRQKYQMELNRIEKTHTNYNTSKSASTDDYMIEAMKKVQSSNASIDQDYARFTGTALYNPPPKPTSKDSLEKTINRVAPQKKTIKESTDTCSDQSIPVESQRTSVSEDKELNWTTIVEQLGKKRWNGNAPTFFNKLNEQLQVSRKGRLI